MLRGECRGSGAPISLRNWGLLLLLGVLPKQLCAKHPTGLY